MRGKLSAALVAVSLFAMVAPATALAQVAADTSLFASLGPDRFPGSEGITVAARLRFSADHTIHLNIAITGAPVRQWTVRIYSRGTCDQVANWVANRGADGALLPAVTSNTGEHTLQLFAGDVQRVRDSLERGEALVLIVAGLHPVTGGTYRTCSPFSATTGQSTAARGPIAGCGAAVVGGTGGRVIAVDTWAELVAAARLEGPRTIRVTGVLNGGGDALAITSPYVTILGPATIVDAWVQVRADQVILRDLRVRAGDGVSVDADAISINNASDVVIDHVEAVWAPDVGGITILNDSDRITVQHSIIGIGLTRSSHRESNDDLDGHNLAFNIAGSDSASAPDCVTVYRNLITTAQGRNPRIQGASRVDVVNNVIYNYHESPAGNPRSLNLIGNLLREGPAPEGRGLGPEEHWVWRTQTSSAFPKVFASSVYQAGNAADGFTMQSPNVFGEQLRTTSPHSLSVDPEPVAGLLDRVLADVGATPDATTQLWLEQAQRRTGTYYNGAGYPAPNPTW